MATDSELPLSHLLSVRDPTCALLSMPTGKLVPYLWCPHGSDFDLAEFVAVLVDGEHDLVNDARLAGAKKCAGITFSVPPRTSFQLQKNNQLEIIGDY